MLWIILFMHDTEPAVRVVEGTQAEASALCDKVRVAYDDLGARVIPFYPSHRDNEAIEEAYKEVS